MSFVATVFDVLSERTADVRLPLVRGGPGLRLSLTPIPGAAAVQTLLDDGTRRIRVEADVSADPEARIDFDIAWLETGALRVEARYPLIYLPGESRYEPAPPIPGRDGGAPLDLLFLVDATCQISSTDSLKLTRRLATPDAAGLWDSLAAIARGLGARHPDMRFGYLAYSDHPLTSRAAAADLISAEPFQPVSGSLLAYRQVDDLAAAFRNVSAAPGGDWVDALAEAMAQVVERASWRQNARKLLIVVGDSPGHSVLDPADAGCDIHQRGSSIEGELDELQHQGVEVAAIYAGPSSTSTGYGLQSSQKIIDHVQTQYRRLASLRQWFWSSTGFDEHVIAALNQPPRWIARGAAYGTDPTVTEVAP